MPNFFLSYRRADQEGSYLAHMVFREIRSKYGEGNAFLDVDSRSPGLSFPVKVESALNLTDAVLVFIGPLWLQLLNERRGDARDWVRYEIAASLQRNALPVVPVCRAGVKIPEAHELPEELKELAWRDGISLDPFLDFDSHLARLFVDLERVLDGLAAERQSIKDAEATRLRAREAAARADRQREALEAKARLDGELADQRQAAQQAVRRRHALARLATALARHARQRRTDEP